MNIKTIIKITMFIIIAYPMLLFTQNPEWINYTNGDQVNALAVQGEGIWVGTNVGGLVKINRTSGKTEFYNKANSELPSNNITSLNIDKNGNIWIVTESN
jgi:ligand-binding sensor domain-containing protein